VLDTRASGLGSLVTPPSHSSGIMCATKTSQFLAERGLQVAINGNGFTYLDPNTINPLDYCPNGQDPLKLNSYAASRGVVYSPRFEQQPILYINQNNVATFNSPKGSIYNAVSGDRMLVEKGKKVANLESDSVEPRSAVGLNQNGRWLILVVVDGRQPGYSDGITFPELADFLISLGAYDGMNLDGGGSSALVIDGKLGQPHVLNSPIEGNIPGNEAEVANHLGFSVRK
jgi:exopolysaccharide biosynthesis protein